MKKLINVIFVSLTLTIVTSTTKNSLNAIDLPGVYSGATSLIISGASGFLAGQGYFTRQIDAMTSFILAHHKEFREILKQPNLIGPGAFRTLPSTIFQRVGAAFFVNLSMYMIADIKAYQELEKLLLKGVSSYRFSLTSMIFTLSPAAFSYFMFRLLGYLNKNGFSGQTFLQKAFSFTTFVAALQGTFIAIDNIHITRFTNYIIDENDTFTHILFRYATPGATVEHQTQVVQEMRRFVQAGYNYTVPRWESLKRKWRFVLPLAGIVELLASIKKQ